MSSLDLHSTRSLAERNAVFWFYLPLAVSAKPSTLQSPVPSRGKRNEAENLCKLGEQCSLGSQKAHLSQGCTDFAAKRYLTPQARVLLGLAQVSTLL